MTRKQMLGRPEGPGETDERIAVGRLAIAAMVDDGRLEVIVVRLGRKFPTLSRDDAADAVYAGVVRCIEKMEATAVTNPAGYIYRRAWFEMLSRRRRQLLSADMDEDTLAGFAGAVEERMPVAAATIREVVSSWPTSNVRRVTMIALDAAEADLQLTDDEIAQQLLFSGFEISPSSVRVWRWRGVQRLRRDLASKGIKYQDVVGLEDQEGDENE